MINYIKIMLSKDQLNFQKSNTLEHISLMQKKDRIYN